MKTYRTNLIAALEQLDMDAYNKILEAVFKVTNRFGELFLIGNGGSSANASHIVNDLAKLVPERTGKRIRVRCLSDNVPLITAMGNDVDYPSIFSEQLKTMMYPGSGLIAFSGSGNSPNIIKAVEEANRQGCLTIGLCGRDGGKLAQVASLSLTVPVESMQLIEDVHLAIGHSLCLDLIHLFQA